MNAFNLHLAYLAFDLTISVLNFEIYAHLITLIGLIR